MVQRVLLDVELYYVENMDDLFDDEDEEKEGDEDDEKSIGYQDVIVLVEKVGFSEEFELFGRVSGISKGRSELIQFLEDFE